MKWIEENIPEADNPLPVLDSEEELENTKFEFSKMNQRIINSLWKLAEVKISIYEPINLDNNQHFSQVKFKPSQEWII